MQFAYNDNGERVQPLYSGERASCPLCHGRVIGKCGKIYARHWQHYNDGHCDIWTERETLWHRDWKKLFPEPWREIIIRKGEKIHIADVKTVNDFVIEFQNSSISIDTITLREKFYGNMIWIVNSKTFFDNFRLQSIVSTRCAEIEHVASQEIYSLSRLFKYELDEIAEQVVKIENDISWTLGNKESKKKKINSLMFLERNFDAFLMNSVEWYNGRKLWWDSETFDLISQIGDATLHDISQNYDDIATTKDQLESGFRTQIRIDKLGVVQINGKVLKVVNYEKLTPRNYYKIYAILKSDLFLSLPKVVTFGSETEFLFHRLKMEQYDYAIDPSDEIFQLAVHILELKKRLSQLQAAIVLKTSNIKAKLWPHIESRIKLAKEELSLIDKENFILESRKKALVDQRTQIEASRALEIETRSAEILKIKRNKCLVVEREMRDLYTFEWRNERKSWRAASCPVFFDLGKEYLYQRMDYNTLKKVQKLPFLDELLLNKFKII